MDGRIEQVAKELALEPELVRNISFDEQDHTMDFSLNGIWYWAKLSKDNRKVINGSVRKAI